MDMPQDILDRLNDLNESPQRFERMLREEGPDFVRGFIENLEESRDLYLEWAPRLRELISESRHENPCPPVDSLSLRDRAKFPIYESLIQSAERLPRRRESEIVICCLPVIAIPIAQRLWPGEDSRSVFLTPEELAQWHNIYTHPDESFWWFIHYHWEIEDPPKSQDFWDRFLRIKLPDGCEPWLVQSSLSWGSLAGGGEADLWAWDGMTARFVNNLWDWTA